MKDYAERIADNVEAAQPDDWERYPHPGKFEGEPLIVLRLYEMTAMGGDAELGEVDGFGWYALLLDVATSEGVCSFIVTETDQGFFGIAAQFDTAKEARKQWERLEAEYEQQTGGTE